MSDTWEWEGQIWLAGNVVNKLQSRLAYNERGSTRSLATFHITEIIETTWKQYDKDYGR